MCRADGAQYFFLTYLTLISASLALVAVFRTLGAAIPSDTVASATGGFVLLLLIISSGFIIVHNAIPAWMIWGYWLSPFSWAMRALAVNEFTSPRWQNVEEEPGLSLGDDALNRFDFYTDRCALATRLTC